MGLQDEWNGLEIEKNLPKGRGSLHRMGCQLEARRVSLIEQHSQATAINLREFGISSRKAGQS